MIQIIISGELDLDELRQLLQKVRDLWVSKPARLLLVSMIAPEMKESELRQVYEQLQPPVTDLHVFPIQEKKPQDEQPYR